MGFYLTTSASTFPCFQINWSIIMFSKVSYTARNLDLCLTTSDSTVFSNGLCYIYEQCYLDSKES